MTQTNAKDILAVMCAPALVCSAAGVVESMNESAALRLGCTPTTASGELVSKFLCAPDEMLSAFLQRTQKIGHACSKGYVYRVSKQSQQTPMGCHAQRLQGLQAPGSLLLVLTDIEAGCVPDECASDGPFKCQSGTSTLSDRSAAEWHLSPADMNGTTALSNVAIGLVHEVNQPLTAVAAYAHSCRRWLSVDSTVHPKLLPTVDKIIEQVHITGQMINSLKGLVRGHDDVRQVCDMNDLMRESLELLALDPRLESCAVDSHFDVKPCPVLVSSAQIKIVLLNLLRNGLEASLAHDATESRLCVSVSMEEESWASATINDSGAGISAEVGEQLFQPFESSKSNGLGLGLIISRCLAAVHAGQIEFYPGVPQGASFQLRLPLAQVSPQ